jgi:GrpB-like predicted nucleotidyltransferase (UPF0157 family)
MSKRVEVVDYSPQWPLAFEQLRQLYITTLNGLIIDIQHVGSTSVPGLAAKPVIDIDIIIESAHRLAPVVDKLAAIGYEHRGNLGMEGREAFKYNIGVTGVVLPSHNLYVCIAGSTSLQNHLLLRNYLLANPAAVVQYASLKKQLAEKYPFDIDKYIEGKTAFIVDILARCGLGADALNRITEANKAPE